MATAICLIRHKVHYRREAFVAGLEALGYRVNNGVVGEVRPDDVLVTWNRYGTADRLARQFEVAGAAVVVAENPYLAPASGEPAYAIARGHHNGPGWSPRGDADRWAALGLEVAPWRSGGRVVLICPQRGIGPVEVAQPLNWTDGVVRRLARVTDLPVRVRPHPGANPPDVAFDDDLADAVAVVVWGSNAGNRAILAGVPVVHELPGWVGQGASRFGLDGLSNLYRGHRLTWCERLAGAQWRLSEIASGDAYRGLLLPDRKAPRA